MRLRRRWLALGVPAALAALVFAALAASSAAAAAVPHVKNAARSSDCEEIELGTTKLYIVGNGVNKPVSLSSTGDCFTLKYKFTYAGNTGYEYQNQYGHCMFLNDTSFAIELGAACKDGDTSEMFFGYGYSGGWYFSVEYDEGDLLMYAENSCDAGSGVAMGSSLQCIRWNFPSG
jgi:hypothetical protein